MPLMTRSTMPWQPRGEPSSGGGEQVLLQAPSPATDPSFDVAATLDDAQHLAAVAAGALPCPETQCAAFQHAATSMGERKERPLGCSHDPPWWWQAANNQSKLGGGNDAPRCQMQNNFPGGGKQ